MLIYVTSCFKRNVLENRCGPISTKVSKVLVYKYNFVAFPDFSLALFSRQHWAAHKGAEKGWQLQ